MAKKPKIEVVQIGLDNFDVEKEIMERANRIVVDTARFANLKPISKAKRNVAQWEEKIKRGVELLIAAVPEGRRIPSNELIAAAEISPNQLGGFITRVRKYLRTDDEWALQKKTVKSKPAYYLVKFSGD